MCISLDLGTSGTGVVEQEPCSVVFCSLGPETA